MKHPDKQTVDERLLSKQPHWHHKYGGAFNPAGLHGKTGYDNNQ
ncbi:MAG: hypothetical protein PVH04_12445 [Gammaproteobacteria bacterium]|jgi:hypothetical protein